MAEKTLKIDGKAYSFDNEPNLLNVIRQSGIDLPTFCYHSELSVYGACRLCIVEEGKMGLVAACSTAPQPGMEIKTTTPRLMRLRKMVLELLLANHCRDCTTCPKNGRCKLQDLAYKFGVNQVRFGSTDFDTFNQPLDTSVDGLVRDPNKCILCGDCVRMCEEIQGIGVLGFIGRGSKTTVAPAFGKDLSEVNCVECGQCVSVCPTGALVVNPDTQQVWKALHDPKKKVVVQVAPAVRMALGEEFGLPIGTDVTGKMVAALRRLGVHAIFDTVLAADITAYEETHEFLGRFKSEGPKMKTMFTSCCPGWVKHAEFEHPELLDQLSTCKSPMHMLSKLIKTYYAEQSGLKADEIFSVAVMPCTAKKFEAARPEFVTGKHRDVDAVITTVELARMIKEAAIDFVNLDGEAFDQPLGLGGGAGLIFGATGGVTEAVLRTAAGMLGGSEAPIEWEAVRGMGGLKEASIQVGDVEVKVGVVHGLANTQELLAKLESGEVHYHLVEVMACSGGCVGGGGQPVPNEMHVRQQRAQGLYRGDKQKEYRRPQDNPIVTKVYGDFLGEAGGHKAHEYLHTHYTPRPTLQNRALELHRGGELMAEVCFCQSCLDHGAAKLADQLVHLVHDSGLAEKATVSGAFGIQCPSSPGVTVRVGSEVTLGVDAEDPKEFYLTKIAGLVV